ncbi:MAG: cysteine-rich CWC family protein [Bacteroidales bacterium]
MKKICPECGKEFVCQHDVSCFCMQYSLCSDVLAFLKKKYDNCLCEECLRKYADRKQKN